MYYTVPITNDYLNFEVDREKIEQTGNIVCQQVSHTQKKISGIVITVV